MNIKFSVQYDIVVAGAGIAGIAAALQAARCGKRVALLEKMILPGGLATSGLVYIYLPLCDGNGTQVLYGLPEELLLASIAYGPGDIPPDWRKEKNAPELRRYRTVFSPAAFILALDELLERHGVDLWYDTCVCDTVLNSEGDAVESLIVCNTSGLGRISAGCFIDASGDCSVAGKTGVDCISEENYLSIWALQCDRRRPAGFESDIRMYSYIEEGSERRIYRGMNGRSCSDFVVRSRRVLREYYRREQAEMQCRMFQQAMDDIDRAIRIDPDEPLYHAERAVVLYRIGEPAEAAKAAQRSVELDPDYAEGYRLMGLCQISAKQREEGLANLRKAAQMGDEAAKNLLAEEEGGQPSALPE